MRLLLDSHIPHAVAPPLREDGFDVETLAGWHGGIHLNRTDEGILEAAAADARTLVSYDCKTIPSLLRAMASTGRSHGGVILVDEKTISQDDVGGLVRALRALMQQYGDEVWTDWCHYLSPA
jgi:predicted nuclease of predicted toxin-antitoxin system